MNAIQLKPLLPEILMLMVACAVLIQSLFVRDREKQSCYLLTQLSLLIIIIYLIGHLGGDRQVLYNGTFVRDNLSQILKIFLLVLTSLSLVYARVFVKGRRLLRGEYYSLTLFAALGMMVMVSAGHLLTLYLGLELLSLTLYAMIAMERDNRLAAEAAIKYFVTGALASGFMLYGMSLLYGVTGHLQLSAIAEAIAQQQGNTLLAQFAVVFLLAGLAFKLGLVPFHMWLPDVYQGAPTSVTAFVASVPKIAAYGFAMRLLLDGLEGLETDWAQILLIAAMLSIALGNLIAIAQTSIKRLLAYSGIAHMGYFALGFYSGDYGGYAAAMFYVVVYAIMTLAAFGLVIFMSRLGYEYETLDDFRGLGRKNPWYALMLTLVMISMAGIPPLIGFWPKLEIFRSLIAAGHWPIAVYAVIFSVVGLYYYLRVIKVVYFDEPQHTFTFIDSRSIRFALTFNCLALLILGMIPDTIYRYCLMAFN
jgi:NADH-quinone oxidoreductase subunit N